MLTMLIMCVSVCLKETQKKCLANSLFQIQFSLRVTAQKYDANIIHLKALNIANTIMLTGR